MNNDLISRSALKEEICKKGIKGYEEYNQGLATALDLIDLAPTIHGIVAFVERPKGEWVYVPTKHQYYCSVCHHWSYDCKLFDFCQDCGAEMKGGSA